eukprot:5833905-Lingulodinium_polyedra.AAC.1
MIGGGTPQRGRRPLLRAPLRRPAAQHRPPAPRGAPRRVARPAASPAPAPLRPQIDALEKGFSSCERAA